MTSSIRFVHYSRPSSQKGRYDDYFRFANAQEVMRFHRSIPGYAPTRLANLSNLADKLGLGGLYIKDESSRFGLNAFKGLGGSYCIARVIGEELGPDPQAITYDMLTDTRQKDFQEKIRGTVFITATDGNHGRGIAWFTHQIGAKAVVFMPQGTAKERLDNIRALGARAEITDFNYDDTVRLARKTAEENGWHLVQDTAWPGYEKVPSWIMQGYLTMALEAFRQLPEKPTHIFLQAGVGSMAGAVAAFAADFYGKGKYHLDNTTAANEKPAAANDQERTAEGLAGIPIITIVEPAQADCIFRTAQADDGKLHKVTGSLSTIMAGLACGEPCTVAWEELRTHADNFISMPDYVAAKGMRVLGNPLPGDPRIISGESGASTSGLVVELMQNPEYEEIRRQLQLDERARVLCFSTEGATDQSNYRRIVWDGRYPSPIT